MEKTCNHVEEAFLSVLRRDVDKKAVDDIFCRFGGDDWQSLYDVSIKHSLSSAFYDKLTKLKLKNIHPEFLSKFKNLYIANLRRNLFLEKELLNILRQFKEGDISVIPLKGTALAGHIHGDIALRNTSCDLDILVGREKVESAEKELAKIGFRITDTGRNAEFWHNYRTEIMLQKKTESESILFLDLHWDFRNRFVNTHVKDFWLNAKDADLDGNRILMPSNEDLLIYLVLTAVSDVDFVQLKYLYDIHALITRFGKEINWNGVTDRVSGLGLKTALYFALYLSKDLFGTDVPDAVLNGSKPALIRRSLCEFVINKANVFRSRDGTASRWPWRHVASPYVLSNNVFDCLKIYYNKTFPSMGEVMGMYNQPVTKRSYYIYAKRLLKPLRCVLNLEMLK